MLLEVNEQTKLITNLEIAESVVKKAGNKYVLGTPIGLPAEIEALADGSEFGVRVVSPKFTILEKDTFVGILVKVNNGNVSFNAVVSENSLELFKTATDQTVLKCIKGSYTKDGKLRHTATI